MRSEGLGRLEEYLPHYPTIHWGGMVGVVQAGKQAGRQGSLCTVSRCYMQESNFAGKVGQNKETLPRLHGVFSYTGVSRPSNSC